MLGVRIPYRRLLGNPEEWRYLVRVRHRWEHNIKMDFITKWECVV
jgi:hypothetical protein